MIIKTLSKDQTTIFKGIAILLIMFHNFFHWIDPINGMENEFVFNQNFIKSVFLALKAEPSEMINILFSYFGHYGVQAFIFLSGLGLAISYKYKPKSWGIFMLDRLKKIYPLLIISFVFFFFARIITDYRFLKIEELRSFGYKFLLIHTFLPNEAESINGPWWFFGLIFQLYILFHVVYKLISKYKIKAFIGICLLSYTFIYLSLYTNMVHGDVRLLHNAIGHLPEFSLGVLYAQSGNKKVSKLLFVAAIIIFALGNYYKALFPFTFISVTYIALCLFLFFSNLNRKPEFIKKFFLFFGKYSMVLFAIHGFYRWQFVAMSKNIDNAGFTVMMSILFIINAVIISLGADYVYKSIIKLYDKVKITKQKN